LSHQLRPHHVSGASASSHGPLTVRFTRAVGGPSSFWGPRPFASSRGSVRGPGSRGLLSVFWIPGYPGPPALGPHHRPIFSPGENRRPKLRRRPSRGGASCGERWWKLLRTRPPHEPPLVRRETKSTPAQHVGMRSKKMKDRRSRTAHATPDREETNFRYACPKRHSGCWPPP
jgi:hypothetical protein